MVRNLIFSYFTTSQTMGRSIELDNRSLVVVEIFNASCYANETRAFIFLIACSTCLEEYQQSNIFRLSIVQAPLWLRFTTKNLTGYLFSTLFLSLRGDHLIFFLEVELTHIHFLSKYQLALFLITRSIFYCEHVGM